MSEQKESFRQEEEELVTGESEILHDLGKGIIAGLVATVAVAVLVFLQGVIGFLPEVSLIGLLTGLTGMTWSGAGWVFLFIAGGVLGIAFASLDAHVGHVTGAGEIVHGILFAVLLWVALMLIFVPVFGGESYAVTFAIIVLVANLLYGIVMGAVYGALQPEEASN